MPKEIKTSHPVISEHEKWLPINGFEGLYEISNTGKVKTLYGANRTKNVGIKIPGIAGPGYYQVQLTRANKTRSCLYVHRLVAMHFIPMIDGKQRVNHKDGNKLNNHYLNLEWCTHKENINHAHDTGLIKNRKIICPKTVLLMRESRKCGNTLKQMSKIFSMHPCSISRAINRNSKTTNHA